MADAIVARPQRHTYEVAKWENHRKPGDGPPDGVVTVSGWFDADGEITDPARVAELERALEENGNG